MKDLQSREPSLVVGNNGDNQFIVDVIIFGVALFQEL